MLPAEVRCDRGFGWPFWTNLVIVLVLGVGAMGAIDDGSPLSWIPGALTGLIGAVSIVVIRICMPRLTLLLSRGLLRARSREAPFAAIAAARFTSHYRAGDWVQLVDDHGRTLGRMAIGSTMLAAAGAEQWAALRHALHVAAIARRAPARPAPGAQQHAMPIGEAIALLDAQVAWCSSGGRSGSSRAPIARLMDTTVSLG